MICSGMHSNLMLRFMVQAFQDPPLCRSTLQLPRKLPHTLGLREAYVTAVCECGGQTGGQPLIPPVRVEHPRQPQVSQKYSQ